MDDPTFTQPVHMQDDKVRICVCNLCGAAILLDPPQSKLDPIERHISFHRALNGGPRG